VHRYNPAVVSPPLAIKKLDVSTGFITQDIADMVDLLGTADDYRLTVTLFAGKRKDRHKDYILECRHSYRYLI
jgi:hypothetical protein